MLDMAGSIALKITPVATGFWKEAKAKIDAQSEPHPELRIKANLAEAEAQLKAFRLREQANALNMRVNIDRQHLDRQAGEAVKRVEHIWKQSDIKKAVRVQVYVAGASALPALAQGIVSVTTSITNLSRAALALPGLLSGVASAAATLLTGFNGVSAALKASNDGMQKSSQYARQYAQASRQLENAQRDVVKALKDANREIEDQKDKLAQGQLSVEQAQLNVRRANQRMFEGGFKSFLDYQEALLNIKQANLDLSIAVKQAGRDVQDYYEYASRGAAQSNTYKDALDKLANSVDQYRKAQFQAAGMSEQFINAMRRLAPAGQDFVLQLLKLRGAWLGLQSSIQTTLFSGLGDSITNLVNRQLPTLKTGMQQVAASINSEFKSLFATLGTDQNVSAMGKIFRSTAQAIDVLRPGINSLVNAFMHLSEVGARFLPRMATAFDHVTARFEAFVDRADKDGSLERWIDSGLKLMASLGRSIEYAGSILSSVSKAYEKATGNVGGFASTMERGLKKFSEYLSGPQGQTALISWIRKSQDFMKEIAQSLPGIRKLFGAIGDAARQFASDVFPYFARLGKFLDNHAATVKSVLELYLFFKTVKPVISTLEKGWNGLNGGVKEYLTTLEKVKKSEEDAYRARLNARTTAYQTQKVLAESKENLDVLKNRSAAARILRDEARAELEEANRAAKQTEKVSSATGQGGRRSLYGLTPKVMAADADALVAATSRQERAQKKYNETQSEYLRLAKTEQSAQRDVAKIKSIATDATVNLETAEKRLSAAAGASSRYDGWIYRMRTGIGSRGGGGLAGAMGGLAGAMGGLRSAMTFISGAIGGAGTLGLIFAFDQWTAAQDRAREASDALRNSQEALYGTMAKGTGSATAATLEENARQLKDHINPVHPDDKNQNFDAAKILEQQMGIPLSEAVQLSLPTEIKKREARLAPADTQVIKAVPGLQEWKQWGEQYKKNGVDETVYGKALNGDQDSIAKVEAARKAIKDANPIGQTLNLGAATATGFAPNDLGAAQEQLPRSGPGGGVRGLSLAAGALRDIGDNSLAAGQRAYESGQTRQTKGLNDKGMRAFGPFVLGPHQTLNADGSATIEVDRYPDDVVKGWVEGARGNGISVERRYPNGAIITIDQDHGEQYFNKFARGGSVWGAGTATSDSIPAMLSNGEFVINAKSASLIGHDKLHAMNRISGYKGGGFIGSGGDGSAIFPPNDNRPLFGDAAGVIGQAPFAGSGNGLIGGAAQGPVSVPVDSSPVTSPIDHGGGSTPGPGGPSSMPNTTPYGGPTISTGPAGGLGGSLGGGNTYIPMYGGSGALPDTISYPGFVGTDASRALNAQINPDANILDYLVQVANAAGLRPGSGPAGPGSDDIARRLGIATHSDDGAQHSVDRALDIGSPEQAQSGQITDFVKAWMADPQKVAATRQLIYQDPKTGEVFAIHHGVIYTGQDALNVYGSDFPQHRDHAHLALEGVPLSAFTPAGGGVSLPGMTVPGGNSGTPSGVPQPAGPASDVPPPAPGPANQIIPGFDIGMVLRQIGFAILKGIFGFFGIDASPLISALFPNASEQDQVATVPQADQSIVDNLEATAQQYESQGNKEMAATVRQAKDNYLKQFDQANVSKNMSGAADYFDSIGDHVTADKIRQNQTQAAPPDQPDQYARQQQYWDERGAPHALSSGQFTAPPANYSGGTPQIHSAVYRAFKEAGFADDQWPPLVALLNHENDTWDPTRPTGGPDSDARGIFQFLSTTWGTVGMQPSDDPYMQSVAGMRYIKNRYGNPVGAWAAWQRQIDKYGHNWYARGGLARFDKGGSVGDDKGHGHNPVSNGILSLMAMMGVGGMSLLNKIIKYPDTPMSSLLGFPGKAGGGYISGPGGPTDDKVPALLSDGEFVMRAAAVDHWGVDQLHAMNCYSGGGPVRRYAPGGSVGPRPPGPVKPTTTAPTVLSNGTFIPATIPDLGVFDRSFDAAKSYATENLAAI